MEYRCIVCNFCICIVLSVTMSNEPRLTENSKQFDINELFKTLSCEQSANLFKIMDMIIVGFGVIMFPNGVRVSNLEEQQQNEIKLRVVSKSNIGSLINALSNKANKNNITGLLNVLKKEPLILFRSSKESFIGINSAINYTKLTTCGNFSHFTKIVSTATGLSEYKIKQLVQELYNRKIDIENFPVGWSPIKISEIYNISIYKITEALKMFSDNYKHIKIFDNQSFSLTNEAILFLKDKFKDELTISTENPYKNIFELTREFKLFRYEIDSFIEDFYKYKEVRHADEFYAEYTIYGHRNGGKLQKYLLFYNEEVIKYIRYRVENLKKSEIPRDWISIEELISSVNMKNSELRKIIARDISKTTNPTNIAVTRFNCNTNKLGIFLNPEYFEKLRTRLTNKDSTVPGEGIVGFVELQKETGVRGIGILYRIVGDLKRLHPEWDWDELMQERIINGKSKYLFHSELVDFIKRNYGKTVQVREKPTEPYCGLYYFRRHISRYKRDEFINFIENYIATHPNDSSVGKYMSANGNIEFYVLTSRVESFLGEFRLEVRKTPELPANYITLANLAKYIQLLHPDVAPRSVYRRLMLYIKEAKIQIQKYADSSNYRPHFGVPNDLAEELKRYYEEKYSNEGEKDNID